MLRDLSRNKKQLSNKYPWAYTGVVYAKLKKNIIFKELMGIIANIIAGMSDVGRSLSSSFNDELTSSDLVLLFDLYNIDTCNKRRYV